MWKKVGESEDGQTLYDPNTASAVGDPGDPYWFVVLVGFVVIGLPIICLAKIIFF